jgi:hypothetical protein
VVFLCESIADMNSKETRIAWQSHFSKMLLSLNHLVIPSANFKFQIPFLILTKSNAIVILLTNRLQLLCMMKNIKIKAKNSTQIVWNWNYIVACAALIKMNFPTKRAAPVLKMQKKCVANIQNCKNGQNYDTTKLRVQQNMFVTCFVWDFLRGWSTVMELDTGHLRCSMLIVTCQHMNH